MCAPSHVAGAFRLGPVFRRWRLGWRGRISAARRGVRCSSRRSVPRRRELRERGRWVRLPAALVLYDVSTLYFETDTPDGFREPGFSKERRLDPQITMGLLTDAGGFPLMVEAFEGNKAETKTMLPVIEAFMAAHHLPGVTVVADEA